MSRRCRSINRAMRRGHPINILSGTYKSKKEALKMRQIWEAEIRKQQKQTTEDNGQSTD